MLVDRAELVFVLDNLVQYLAVLVVDVVEHSPVVAFLSAVSGTIHLPDSF